MTSPTPDDTLSPTSPTDFTTACSPSEPPIIASSPQRDAFKEGIEICVYDIVYKSGTMEEHLGYVGENITFSRFYPTPTKVTMEQPTSRKIVEYKALLEYGGYSATYSCETTDNESTFTNFKLLSLNERMERELDSEEPMEFEFSTEVDDEGMPFLAWYMDCGWSGCSHIYLSGWAKTRDIGETELTRAERKRLSKVDILGVGLQYHSEDKVDEADHQEST